MWRNPPWQRTGLPLLSTPFLRSEGGWLDVGWFRSDGRCGGMQRAIECGRRRILCDWTTRKEKTSSNQGLAHTEDWCGRLSVFSCHQCCRGCDTGNQEVLWSCWIHVMVALFVMPGSQVDQREVSERHTIARTPYMESSPGASGRWGSNKVEVVGGCPPVARLHNRQIIDCNIIWMGNN